MFKQLTTKLVSLFWKYFPLLSIALIVLLVGNANVTPGTYLSGWDNLHPEFDFATNIQRALFGVWQEYQGLGVLGGNAHATELLREVYLWFTSLFLPQWFIRYAYHLVYWAVGGFGAYFLTQKIVTPEKLLAHNTRRIQLTALVAAVFYLLNLGTLQNFYVPYESFTHHFAFIPWILLYTYKYLEKPSKKNLLLLALIHLLASPMYYIPTIFIVSSIMQAVVTGIHFLQHRSVRTLKHIALVWVAILCINAYWLGPFAYFVSQGTEFVSESSINAIFTDEAFLRNQLYGSLPNVVIMKGFWFSNTDLDTPQGIQRMMMEPWLSYTQRLDVRVLLYTFFGLAVSGVVGLFKDKSKYRYTVAVLFGISMFALLNDNFPTGVIFRFLQEHAPLFKQVFRLPFTKFIMLTSLVYSLLVGYGVHFLMGYTKKIFVRIGIAGITVAAIIFVSWPSFTGHFFYEKMRVSIPEEYFATFSYFQAEPNVGKVAYLPQPTFWGWMTYDWGYRGSGFPWYGVPQPILDRAFDVWSLENEDYYHELAYALYDSSDIELLQSVLTKYHVNYIWIDASIISPHKSELSNAESILEKTKQLNDFETTFAVGKQTVLKRVKTEQPLSSISAVAVQTDTRFALIDAQFEQLGDYFLSNKSGSEVVLADLTGVKHSWKTKETADGLYLYTQVSSAALTLEPHLENNVPVAVTKSRTEDVVTITRLRQQLYLDGQPITQQNQSVSSLDLGVNSTEFITLDNAIVLPDTGPQNLVVQKTANISFFDVNSILSTTASPELFVHHPTNCAVKQSDDYKILVENNILTFSGSKSTLPCVYEKLTTLVPNLMQSENKIYDVIVTMKAASDAQLAVCITDTAGEECIQNQMPNQVDTDWQSYKYTFPTLSHKVTDSWLKLQFSNGDTNSKITIKDVVVRTVNKPTKTISASKLTSSEASSLAVEKPSELSLFIPNKDAKMIQVEDLNHAAQNCYTASSGDFSRIVQIDSSMQKYVRYKAENASSCETYYLGNAFKTGAVIAITHRTVSGRPLKICLRHDPPGHCVREMLLSQTNGDWRTEYIVIPPLTTDSSDLFLEVDNFALGNELRVNDVDSVVVYPFLYDNTVSVSNFEKLEYAVTEIAHQLKKNSFWYTAQLDGPTVLELDQGERNGWVAFTVSPLTIFERVKVNGWANGWIVPEGTWHIYVIYWPQFILFVGLFVLLSWLYAAVRMKELSESLPIARLDRIKNLVRGKSKFER